MIIQRGISGIKAHSVVFPCAMSGVTDQALLGEVLKMMHGRVRALEATAYVQVDPDEEDEDRGRFDDGESSFIFYFYLYLQDDGRADQVLRLNNVLLLDFEDRGEGILDVFQELVNGNIPVMNAQLSGKRGGPARILGKVKIHYEGDGTKASHTPAIAGALFGFQDFPKLFTFDEAPQGGRPCRWRFGGAEWVDAKILDDDSSSEDSSEADSSEEESNEEAPVQTGEA